MPPPRLHARPGRPPRHCTSAEGGHSFLTQRYRHGRPLGPGRDGCMLIASMHRIVLTCLRLFEEVPCEIFFLV